MDIRFSTYNDFLTEYQTYKLDKCSNCEGVRELIDDDVTVVIENRTLHFPELLVLCCNKCGDKCLPEYSKQIIDGAYKSMIEQEQFVGEFVSKSYKRNLNIVKKQIINTTIKIIIISLVFVMMRNIQQKVF